MSNVIRFLESMGRDAAMSRISADEYRAAIASLDANDEQRRALLGRDSSALSNMLGGRAKMWCLVAVPEHEEPAHAPAEPDGDGDQEPDGSPDSSAS